MSTKLPIDIDSGRMAKKEKRPPGRKDRRAFL
jgi:hypothetical protein